MIREFRQQNQFIQKSQFISLRIRNGAVNWMIKELCSGLENRVCWCTTYVVIIIIQRSFVFLSTDSFPHSLSLLSELQPWLFVVPSHTSLLPFSSPIITFNFQLQMLKPTRFVIEMTVDLCRRWCQPKLLTYVNVYMYYLHWAIYMYMCICVVKIWIWRSKWRQSLLRNTIPLRYGLNIRESWMGFRLEADGLVVKGEPSNAMLH